jgi:hypothetical protein
MVQNKAIRFIILDLKGICSISEAREQLQLETLESRHRKARISLLMKIV